MFVNLTLSEMAILNDVCAFLCRLWKLSGSASLGRVVLLSLRLRSDSRAAANGASATRLALLLFSSRWLAGLGDTLGPPERSKMGESCPIARSTPLSNLLLAERVGVRVGVGGLNGGGGESGVWSSEPIDNWLTEGESSLKLIFWR